MVDEGAALRGGERGEPLVLEEARRGEQRRGGKPSTVSWQRFTLRLCSRVGRWRGGVGGGWVGGQRYKFVLKDHSLEFHRYLPTGLHDPQVTGGTSAPKEENGRGACADAAAEADAAARVMCSDVG